MTKKHRKPIRFEQSEEQQEEKYFSTIARYNDTATKVLASTPFFDLTGDWSSAIMLSRIYYWHTPTESGKTKLRLECCGQYWMYRNHADWWAEIRLDKKAAQRALEVLKTLEYVHVKRGKNPEDGFATNVLYIRINWKVFLPALRAALDNASDAPPSAENRITRKQITELARLKKAKEQEEKNEKRRKKLEAEHKQQQLFTPEISKSFPQIPGSFPQFLQEEERPNGQIVYMQVDKLSFPPPHQTDILSVSYKAYNTSLITNINYGGDASPPGEISREARSLRSLAAGQGKFSPAIAVENSLDLPLRNIRPASQCSEQSESATADSAVNSVTSPHKNSKSAHVFPARTASFSTIPFLQSSEELAVSSAPRGAPEQERAPARDVQGREGESHNSNMLLLFLEGLKTIGRRNVS